MSTIRPNPTLVLSAWQRGSNDRIVADDGTAHTLIGDADDITMSARGGNDIIIGGDGFNDIAGDAYNTISGDGRGGNDQIRSGAGKISDFTVITGDAGFLTDRAIGGNDNIDWSFIGEAYIMGDAYDMLNNAVGGNDVISLSNSSGSAIISGDAVNEMSGSAKGGHDVIRGGTANSDGSLFSFLQGDAFWMLNNTIGGDDMIIGTSGDNAANQIFGDAYEMYDNAKGGNDTLIGGAHAVNVMFGDASNAYGAVIFGNDRLISGAFADDFMWGDAATGRTGQGGADVFVFEANNGNDIINDFEVGHDKIDLGAFDIMNWADLQLAVVGNNTVITLSDGNTVTVEGVTNLQSTDFILG